ncbi:MAG TPA: helix-turn-helix domain-containing protein [Trebonia sp.]|jgi:hypothetical protein
MHPQTTVDRARRLSQQGLIDREVARITGVPTRTVQRWRTGTRRAPGKGREPSCPRCTGRPLDEAAYAYLLGLYLGDGCLTRGRRDVFALSIACCDDWPGLLAAAKRTMSAVMPASSVFGVRREGMTEVKSYSKHWPCLFPQHGPGRKHTRRIELAGWQRGIVEKHPGDFARGLFHSDGYRGVNRVHRTWGTGERWYEYPRYLFTNNSADILRLCGETLDQLGVAWRFSKPNTISVARREAVEQLDEFVGPKY